MTHANLLEKIAEAIRDQLEMDWDDYDPPHFATSVSAVPLAQAALTAISEAGYVVVPREPTLDMMEAWQDGMYKNFEKGSFRDAYASMIAQAEKEG